MSIYEPEAVEALGNVKAKVVLAINSVAAPSLATEVNAATSVEVTLVFDDWNPQLTPNTGTAKRRMGTKNQFPREGFTQYAGIPVAYPYDPQADTSDPNNQAMATLAEGTIVYVVVRKGPDSEVAFAAADKVEVWKVRCGKQIRTRSGDDEFAEFEIRQNLYPISEEELDAEIAA